MKAPDPAQILEELTALLAVTGRVPISPVGCDALVNYVGEQGRKVGRRTSQSTSVAIRATWLVISESVSKAGTEVEQPDDWGTLPERPLVAAKHLLCMGEYPVDPTQLVPDTGRTLQQIKDVTRPPIKGNDPRTNSGLRRTIALIAGRCPTSRRLMSPDSPRIAQAAQALWEAVEAVVANPVLLRRLFEQARTDVKAISSQKRQLSGPDEPAVMVAQANALPAVVPAKAQVAVPQTPAVVPRRKRTAQAGENFLDRHETIAHALFLLSVAAVLSLLGGVIFSIVSLIIAFNQAPTSNVDPLGALKSGATWSAGLGPSMDQRLRVQEGKAFLNPIRTYHMLPFASEFIEGPFLSVDDLNIDVKPGTYKVSVPISVEDLHGASVPGLSVSGARLELGLLPGNGNIAVDGSLESRELFARITADGVAPIWDGKTISVVCNCSVSIDPTSIELFSDVLPKGVLLGDGALDPGGVRIGSKALDGVLESGVRGNVRVIASLVVTSQ